MSLVKRRNTKAGISPFDKVDWDTRTATITNEKGETVFEQKDVETPLSWSQMSTNVVASKYFSGKIGTNDRETSIKQLIGRVSKTISDWGIKDGYFDSLEDRNTFDDELTYLLLHQKAAFNSPVWFNVGVNENPQCSACFINSVEDTMESILDLVKTEGMLFKFGSGTGTNLSTLRSSKEYLSNSNGKSSGPVSFMKGFDSFAGVIKSGGKTRRAAKMVILNDNHPDIEDFIICKSKEEEKAYSLIKQGYDPSIDGEAYSSIYFQNANHSVRLSNDFMRAVENDDIWYTLEVTTGNVSKTVNARDLFTQIIDSSWKCGDPGIQFDDTINNWHTCPNTSKINASNPCSEYMFLDDSACNLSSLNLMKFKLSDGEFDIDGFAHAVSVMIIAMDIIVGNSSYPTKKIAENSHNFRPLGLGYANLGALLMSIGLPYDSERGREYASDITALMTGYAYKTSAIIAEKIGAFAGYEKNIDPMMNVVKMHKLHLRTGALVPSRMCKISHFVYSDALKISNKHGFRNSQVTVLAPTGTIAFMMDCDTTGVEPDISLVKYKKLVGGGLIKMVNSTLTESLKVLGYDKKGIESILNYVEHNETIEGAPGLSENHLPVFDCAFKPENGERSISPMGHIKMMEAVQPFISGAISKTINMPNDATIEDVKHIYIEAWKKGLKSISIYRDGCKQTQPLSTSLKNEVDQTSIRKRLPDERKSITHKFSIAEHEGYITVGMYENGAPGEMFIIMSKEGSTISGIMDSFATSVSIALQHGVPISVLIGKLKHTRFEPSGFTKNQDLPITSSIMDYIARWLEIKFLSSDKEKNNKSDAPICSECGDIMVRNGTCHRCLNCGSTSGCS